MSKQQVKSEQRIKWQEDVAQVQRERDMRRREIQKAIVTNRHALKHVHDKGLDWVNYDILKAEQRRLTAELTTL